jgi:hypothetical protein
LKVKGAFKRKSEIQKLELLKMKFNKNYIDNLTSLLYDSKNYKNYHEQRNILKQLKYEPNKKFDFPQPLPKILGKNKINDDKTENITDKVYLNTDTNLYSNDNKLMNIDEDILFRDDLEEDSQGDIIKEENMTKKQKDRGKFLFEKLTNNYGGPFGNREKNSKSLDKFKKVEIPEGYQLLATPSLIKEFDYPLGHSFENGKLRYLTQRQKEKLSYISELTIFDSINKLKEKTNIIKKIKIPNTYKKKILLPLDCFKYDREKWRKYTLVKNRNNNDIVISKLNDENEEKINNMKFHINKLKADSMHIDKDVNKVINNIDLFLKKNGIEKEKASRRASFMSSRGKFKKERKESSEFKENIDNDDISDKN